MKGELPDPSDLQALCARAMACGRDPQPSTLQAQVQATCALGAPPNASFGVITQGVVATADSGEWILSGAAPAALVSGISPRTFAVVAHIDGSPAVFAISSGAGGLRSAPIESFDGLPSIEVSFDQVRTSAAPLRRDVTVDFFAPAVVALCAEIIGAANAALDLALARARTRRVFGRSIGSFQALAHRLVDAKIDLESMELALQEITEDGATGFGASALKALCSAVGPRIVSTAQQVYGGEGYHADLPLPWYTRRVLGLSHRLGNVAEHHARLLQGMSHLTCSSNTASDQSYLRNGNGE